MSKKPKQIIVIDCETDPFKHGRVPEPFVWGVYDDQYNYSEFWDTKEKSCTEQLVEHLYNLDAIVYAHNGGKFDFFFLLPWLETGTIMLIGSRISRANIGACELRDSYNILPIPLAAYQKDKFDYSLMEKEVRHKHKKTISAYLYNDCKYLMELVQGFIDRFGNKLTLASASMTEIQKTFNDKIVLDNEIKQTPVQFKRLNKYQDDRYRDYYYGGRCQAFQKGKFKGRFKMYDINSAYPYAMKHKHPSPLSNRYKQIDYLPDADVYFARIIAISRGALPWRDEDDYRLLFPDDDIAREYYVTGYEIRAGIDTSTLTIIKVIEVFVPEETANFSTFIDKFYNERKQAKASGDKLNDILCKLVMNSGYGKFGIDPREHKDHLILKSGVLAPGEQDEAGIYKTDWELGHMLPEYDIDIYWSWKYEEKYIGEAVHGHEAARFYNVSIAASITGFVRAYLWRFINQSKTVLYCDTDSIICESSDVETGDELGQWKLEAEGDLIYIAGKKLYAFYHGDKKKITAKFNDTDHWKIASKGVRIGPGEIADIVDNDKEIEWFNQAPTFNLKNCTRFIQRKVKKT